MRGLPALQTVWRSCSGKGQMLNSQGQVDPLPNRAFPIVCICRLHLQSVARQDRQTAPQPPCWGGGIPLSPNACAVIQCFCQYMPHFCQYMPHLCQCMPHFCCCPVTGAPLPVVAACTSLVPGCRCMLNDMRLVATCGC